jgi:hypothetical protein
MKELFRGVRWGLPIVAFMLGSALSSQERITLTTPIARPSVADYSLQSLLLDGGDPATDADDRISIRLRPNIPEAEPILHSYVGTEANTLIRQLNTADLRANSLQRRVMNKLILDGIIAGSITGTPQ